MLLAIDIGNTNTVLGVFAGDRLVDSWRIKSDSRNTADELALAFRGLLDGHARRRQSPPARPSPPCCASCARCSRATTPTSRRCWSSPAYAPASVSSWTTRRRSAPTASATPRPRTTSSTAPCIVVDFGTSTNFDVISAKGEFVGGALAPGIEISLDALAARAAQLRKVELVAPRNPIGKNTVEALQSGIIYGFAGQVDGMVKRLSEALVPGAPESVQVIATGGLASLVIDHSASVTRYEPELTLVGLRLIYERNT